MGVVGINKVKRTRTKRCVGHADPKAVTSAPAKGHMSKDLHHIENRSVDYGIYCNAQKSIDSSRAMVGPR